MMFDIDLHHKIGGRIPVSLTIRSQAGIVGIVGSSGAGKTTALKMIAGLIKPHDGHVRIQDNVLFDSAAGIDIPPGKRRCGYVFQDDRLFPHMTVRANLAYGRSRAGGTAFPLMDLEETAETLGITALLHRWPRHLSGGEVKRVAIGRALLSSPHVLLLDEPLASVDQRRRSAILHAIAALRNRSQIPMLYVTHDERELEFLAADIVRIDSQ